MHVRRCRSANGTPRANGRFRRHGPEHVGIERRVDPAPRLERQVADPHALPIGLPHQTEIVSCPPINIGPLNLEQIEAAARAMSEPLSVVTGPPGTGKSQVIVSIAATALWNGQRVLILETGYLRVQPEFRLKPMVCLKRCSIRFRQGSDRATIACV